MVNPSTPTAIIPVIHDSNPNLVSNVVIEMLTKPLTVAPVRFDSNETESKKRVQLSSEPKP